MINFSNYFLHIVAMLLLISIVKGSAYMERARNLRYNLTLLCVCVCMVGLFGRENSDLFQSRIIGIISAYLYLISILLYFVFFIGSLLPPKSKLMNFWRISCGILILITLSSPFTGIFFTIDQNGRYIQSKFIIIGLAWMCAAYATLMVVNFQKYSACEFADKFRLVFLFLFEVVAIVLQFFLPEQFNNALIGSSLITILYYAFVIEIESKYDKKSEVFSATYYTNYVNTLSKKGGYALIIFDVNGLKSTNDNLGHEKGDELITAVAVSVKDAVGRMGKVFRLGGDEFVAVVDSCNEVICDEVIKKSLDGFDLKSEEIGIKVSAAYGMAVRKDDEDAKDLLILADKRMYECKQAYYQQEGNNRRGRNR